MPGMVDVVHRVYSGPGVGDHRCAVELFRLSLNELLASTYLFKPPSFIIIRQKESFLLNPLPVGPPSHLPLQSQAWLGGGGRND